MQLQRNIRKVSDLSLQLLLLSKDCHTDDVKRAEIKVAALVVEHNLSFHPSIHCGHNKYHVWLSSLSGQSDDKVPLT